MGLMNCSSWRRDCGCIGQFTLQTYTFWYHFKQTYRCSRTKHISAAALLGEGLVAFWSVTWDTAKIGKYF
ncbi:hypothetical protein BDR03DRAFT_941001 [Suillus americanus]|nr:hypothetical protein BDR03DRAFT_941001 [Suillus americanus]